VRLQIRVLSSRQMCFLKNLEMSIILHIFTFQKTHIMIITKNCPSCNKDFDSDSRKRKKFCNSSCAASFNNKHRNRKTRESICIFCNNIFSNIRGKQKYCSLKCSSQHKSHTKYEELLNNNFSSTLVTYIPSYAKKFILKEQNCRCNVCGNLNEWNNKEIIFVLDHIDGNSTNNKRENLRLVCPNCDSQLDTYKSKNKGKGRFSRRTRYKEGKSF
jgi:hypothetical protein